MTRRSRPLGSGLRLRRDRSLLADAQRRFNVAAGEGEVLKRAPTPNPSPQRATRAGGGERAVHGERVSPNIALTPLTHQARALYEGGVVPVRELARLCGVSLRTLYHHVHRQGWRRRRSSVPRDAAKSERQRLRYQALKASRPASPRGLKARDPDGQAAALAGAARAAALAGAALARALARQDAEAAARMLSIMTRALRSGRAVGSPRPKVARLNTVRLKKPKASATTWRSYSEGELEEMRRELFRKITARMARDDGVPQTALPRPAPQPRIRRC